MPNKEWSQAEAAREFAKRWKDRGSEKQEAQTFWEDLLENVYDIPKPYNFIKPEKPVKVNGHNRSIDFYIPKTKVLIEHKISSKSLDSKGELGTAYEQAIMYETGLPLPEKPKWIITCNFKEFRLYDRVHPERKPVIFRLEDLGNNLDKLEVIVNDEIRRIAYEDVKSVEVASAISGIYNDLIKAYGDNPTNEELTSLNIFCVRLAFCMYASKAGVFDKYLFPNLIAGYLKHPGDLKNELLSLFNVLDTPVNRRKFIPENLKAFPYVNGGLFKEAKLDIPQIDKETAEKIYAACFLDWEQISPAIFSAAYESTVNPETRHQLGMYYTSQENIHKVIDPLFLNDLKFELDKIKESDNKGGRKTRALKSYIEKLANLKFLDPACGSGNFLTETYIELRRLENEALKELLGTQVRWDVTDKYVNVSIESFYGIEINDFAVAVARTSLWIAELKMLKETQRIINSKIDMLPLNTYPNIIEGNALKIDWNKVISAKECNYIMGNPPFLGKKEQSKTQKEELIKVFDNSRVGNLNYVAAWFVKSAKYINDNPNIKVCFVATNTITKGEQVSVLWKKLLKLGIHINFAYESFIWRKETKISPAIVCVIIGFSKIKNKEPVLFKNSDEFKIVKNISPYLKESDNLIISSRRTPICKSPRIDYGNMANDDGYLILNRNEVKKLQAENSLAKDYIREYIGCDELLKNKQKWCLWLKDASPSVINHSPFVKERVQKIKDYRLSSRREATNKLAEKPHLFGEIRQPESRMLVIPKVSKNGRKYIPMSFIEPSIIPSGSLFMIPDAQNYHFGVLTSRLHILWTREVGGSLGDSIHYSKNVVYNNFPWPNPTKKQKQRIEQTAQAILDARAKYPGSSLADLYDSLTMPVELRKAHHANDLAVMDAYGFDHNLSENEIVAELFKLYQKIIEEEN